MIGNTFMVLVVKAINARFLKSRYMSSPSRSRSRPNKSLEDHSTPVAQFKLVCRE
jgi:hypothetical protein